MNAGYTARFLEAALHDLSRLDKPVARRILARIEWLVANFESLTAESLAGDLNGLYKLRVGDYRVIYEVLRYERILVVHNVGHRREVYRKRG